jgi:hypothetical protein
VLLIHLHRLITTISNDVAASTNDERPNSACVDDDLIHYMVCHEIDIHVKSDSSP